MGSNSKTVYIFNQYGMGNTEHSELSLTLAQKFLTLIAEMNPLPAQICFYTNGVRLCINDSPVLAQLRILEERGVELILCSTCLDFMGLRDQVAVGIIGGMGDILSSLSNAGNTITL